MKVYTGYSFANVFKFGLYDLLYNPSFISKPRGLTVKEILGVSFEFNPQYFLFKNEIKSSEINYINGELEWYFKGRDDIQFISKYSKFWKNVCNADGSCNSAYGKLLFKDLNNFGVTQYQWALRKIIQDSDTRQALMFLNNQKFQYEGNKDFVCTSYIILFVREEHLYMRVYMRSNDAIYGTVNDVAFFCLLQQQILRHLKKFIPNIKLGTYTHTVDSFHLYENKFSLVEDMLKNNFLSIIYELDYDIIDSNGNFIEFKKLKT